MNTNKFLVKYFFNYLILNDNDFKYPKKYIFGKKKD